VSEPFRYVVWQVEGYNLVNGRPRAAADTARAPKATAVDFGVSGSWRIKAGPSRQDVTVVRGAPTQLQGLTTTDPFGPAAAELVFPALTVFDSLGVNDLAWAARENDVDIEWVDDTGTVVFTWEGYFLSYSYDKGGVSIACLGAMRQLDNYQAKPEYPSRPYPYEVAVARQFTGKANLRLGAFADLQTAFPVGWAKTYDAAEYLSSQPWTVPQGVSQGQKWTGLLTRRTGEFEQALSGYVQGLLSNMQTDTGQFTLALNPGRIPALKHRTILTVPDATTLTVDLVWPGVEHNLEVDYSQRADVVYAAGTSTAGLAYSGMQVSVDGAETYYDPAAFLDEVHPTTDNPLFDSTAMRKEVKVDFGDGLTPKEAAAAAQAYLDRFAEPGITGTITLDTDPLQGSLPYARQAITAGMTVFIRGLFGAIASTGRVGHIGDGADAGLGDVVFGDYDPGTGSSQPGIVCHITETSVDLNGTMTLTIDSKYRDHLTVDQIRNRGRDSIVPFRSIATSGTYTPKVPDLLFPWSYVDGAGIIPAPATNALTDNIFRRAAQQLLVSPGSFTGDPDRVGFPWTPYTTLYPPSTHPQYYARARPANWANADANWANANWQSSRTLAQNLTFFQPYKVKLAAAGEIKLIQIAAYNAAGQVKPVWFHVSLYAFNGVTYSKMPVLPGNFAIVVPAGSSTTYVSGQHNPFYDTAWEKWNPDGTKPLNDQTVVAADGGSFLMGWGTFYEQAGFWPGSSAKAGDPVTGMLVDEVGFGWDFKDDPAKIDPRKSYAEQAGSADVYAYVMIYCDVDPAADTYFLGRLWRREYAEV
jgi:hypothetical protein